MPGHRGISALRRRHAGDLTLGDRRRDALEKVNTAKFS